MKIAKKVLAVVMALAMVAGFACVSFAAGAKVSLVVSEIADDGTFTVSAVAKDYADLKAADWVVTYDAAVLNCTATANGSGDYSAIATDTVLMSAASGLLQTAFNANDDGKVLIGFAFQDQLATAAETVLFTLTFAVEDKNATEVVIELSGTDAAKKTVTLKEVETEAPETTTAAPETTTEVEEVSSSVVANPDTGDGGTGAGDNMALAAAFGVVALAGAAFVITKKRK